MAVEHVVTPIPRRTTIHVGAPVVIILSALLHVVTGAALIYRNANLNLLVLSGLTGPRDFFGFSANQLGAVLIVLGLLALVGVALENRVDIRVVTFFVIWQYSLMLWSLVVDVILIYDSINPNPEVQEATPGATLNRAIFIQVLAPVMVIAIGHTWAFWDRYVRRWFR